MIDHRLEAILTIKCATPDALTNASRLASEALGKPAVVHGTEMTIWTCHKVAVPLVKRLIEVEGAETTVHPYSAATCKCV